MKPDPQEDKYVCKQDGCGFTFTGEQYDWIKKAFLRAGWIPPTKQT